QLGDRALVVVVPSLEETDSDVDLALARLATERVLVEGFDLRVGIATGGKFDTVGERYGLLIHKVAVQQDQRLRRNGGDAPLCDGRVGVGLVERFQERDAERSFDEDIDAAAGLLIEWRLVPSVTRPRLLGEHFRR